MLARYIGRKNATLVEMALRMVARLFGYLVVDAYNSLPGMLMMLRVMQIRWTHS